MVWLDNISLLQYFTQPKGVPCYCEIIVFPTDMTLQASFPPNSGSFSAIIEVMSPDGSVVYEDATSYFNIYYFVAPNGNYVANIQLKSFSPQMCAQVCYIIRARIFMGGTLVFDKYTERYCQSSCCDIARDVTMVQNGISIGGDGTVSPADEPRSPTFPKYTECGDPIITLKSRFDCLDNFTGEVYGTPTNILNGSATFEFHKVSNMRGTVAQRPSEISREYSYNCRLQRVESKKVYFIEGLEYFPTWKMNEIEGQFRAKEIYVDDVRYEYSGGTPFKKLWNCDEVFKLETTLEDCTIRQVFGCGTGCDTVLNYDGLQAMFILPENADTVTYRDENGIIVANSYDELLNYFRGLNGITAVNDIDVSGLDCGVYKAFSISGDGYIPTSFFYDDAYPQNRIFSKVLGSFDEICQEYGATCRRPEIIEADVSVEAQICEQPSINSGDIIIEEMAGTEVAIIGVGNWELVDSGTDLNVFQGFATLNLEVTNDTIFEDPAQPAVNVYVYGTIALIAPGGRPTNMVVFDETNSTLAAGNYLVINTDGTVVYSGTTTTASDINVAIDFDTLNYSL